MLNHVLIDPSSPLDYGFWLHKTQTQSRWGFINSLTIHCLTWCSMLGLWEREGTLPSFFGSPLDTLLSLSQTDKTVNQLSASCCYNNRPLSLQFCTFPEESRHTQLTQPTCMVEFHSTCIFWLKHASQHQTQDTESSIPLKKHLQCTAVIIIDASKTYFHLSFMPFPVKSMRAGAQVFFIWPESWLAVSCAVF